jgi:predicted transcriptional regulator
MIRFTVRLSEAQMRGMRQLAKRRGISLAECFRQAIDHYLASCKREETGMGHPRVKR